MYYVPQRSRSRRLRRSQVDEGIQVQVAGPNLLRYAVERLLMDFEGVRVVRDRGEVVVVCGPHWREALAGVFGATRPAVVVVTHLDEAEVRDAQNRNVEGLIATEDDPSTLQRGLFAVKRGEPFYSESMTQVLLRVLKADADPRQGRRSLDRLSVRELEVASCIASGLSNRQIGDRLFISETTVKFHLHNIFAKLKIGDRLELCSRWRELKGGS
jgi:DNA-binding NarL/FixJ family response regulator